MLPERRSTTSSVLNSPSHNEHGFSVVRRGRRFSRLAKPKLSHFVSLLVVLFFVSFIVSCHKMFFQGDLQKGDMENRLLMSAEDEKGFTGSDSGKPTKSNMENHLLTPPEVEKGFTGSESGKPTKPKHRKQHLPCEVALAESVDRIIEPQEYLNFTRFSLEYVEKEEDRLVSTSFEPRFGGHQTLEEREKSFNARNQTVHCGFIKVPRGFKSTGFELNEMDKAYMRDCVVAVSSCIFGSSDFLRRPTSKKISEFSKKHVCFVMFADEQTLSKLSMEGHVPDDQGYIGLWKIVIVRNLPYADMRKTGKVPKFLSHRLFPSSR